MSEIRLIADSIPSPAQKQITHQIELTFKKKDMPATIVKTWESTKNPSFYNLSTLLDAWVPDWESKLISRIKVKLNEPKKVEY